MKNLDRDKLMHAALDGDATPEQARELDALLAADPAAREQFAELQRLFVALRQVPQAYPPEGLVARVMEQLPEGSARRRQLSGASRVLGTEAIELRGKTAGISSTVRPQGGASWGWFGMGTNKGLSKGKLWIGGGIAAVAVLAVAKLGFDVPSSGDSVSGTVVPAERYRAKQMSSDDVKVGSPTAVGTAGSGGPAADGQANAQSNNLNNAQSNNLNNAQSNNLSNAQSNNLSNAAKSNNLSKPGNQVEQPEQRPVEQPEQRPVEQPEQRADRTT